MKGSIEQHAKRILDAETDIKSKVTAEKFSKVQGDKISRGDLDVRLAQDRRKTKDVLVQYKLIPNEGDRPIDGDICDKLTKRTELVEQQFREVQSHIATVLKNKETELENMKVLSKIKESIDKLQEHGKTLDETVTGMCEKHVAMEKDSRDFCNKILPSVRAEFRLALEHLDSDRDQIQPPIKQAGIFDGLVETLFQYKARIKELEKGREDNMRQLNELSKMCEEEKIRGQTRDAIIEDLQKELTQLKESCKLPTARFTDETSLKDFLPQAAFDELVKRLESLETSHKTQVDECTNKLQGLSDITTRVAEFESTVDNKLVGIRCEVEAAQEKELEEVKATLKADMKDLVEKACRPTSCDIIDDYVPASPQGLRRGVGWLSTKVETRDNRIEMATRAILSRAKDARVMMSTSNGPSKDNRLDVVIITQKDVC